MNDLILPLCSFRNQCGYDSPDQKSHTLILLPVDTANNLPDGLNLTILTSFKVYSLNTHNLSLNTLYNLSLLPNATIKFIPDGWNAIDSGTSSNVSLIIGSPLISNEFNEYILIVLSSDATATCFLNKQISTSLIPPLGFSAITYSFLISSLFLSLVSKLIVRIWLFSVPITKYPSFTSLDYAISTILDPCASSTCHPFITSNGASLLFTELMTNNVPFEHPAINFLLYSNNLLTTKPSKCFNLSGKYNLTILLNSHNLSNINTSLFVVHTNILVSLFLSTNYEWVV